MPLSIRLRLTLWYSAILAVTLVAFALAVYTLLSRNLTAELDSQLHGRADPLVRILALDRPADSTHEAGLEGVMRAVSRGGAPNRPGPAPAAPPEPGNTYLQILSPDGAVLYRSPSLAGSGLVLPAPRDPRGQSFSHFRVDGLGYRVYYAPIFSGRYAGGVVEAAGATANADQTLDKLRTALVLGVIGALLLAGACGWLLATVALRPIERLTRAAHEIGESQDFSRRVAYPGPRDELGRLAGTFNDMLASLQSAFARVQTALESQRRFVADASHELRTPLTTIRGNVELLALDETGESPERSEALHDIASEAERMSRLVAQLLMLARADAGVHIQRQPLEVRPLVEEVYRQARLMAGGVRLELGELPQGAIDGSADHLKQLLLILLDNAIKYTPDGGHVCLGGGRDGTRIWLSVRDSGPGIPPEQQPRIFDRFYQLDPSRHGEGAGLGLSIARWIAVEHGGGLSVQSTLGQGSTFTLELPARAAETTFSAPAPVAAR